MPPRSSTAVVLAVAAATGVALARVAGGAAPPPGPAPASALAPGPAPAPASASASGSRDDTETDELPRPPENPYDEAAPRPAIVRQQVQSRDGMLRLSGGRFTVGSASTKSPPNERPARPSSVAPLWIDRTEVTVGAYRVCVEAGTCARPARSSATCTFDAADADLPVSCVHWHDAETYCRSVGKRLPTEREWEFAARGTVATSFPWGTVTSCNLAVTLVNEQSGRSCAGRPARVGTHPAGASAFGVQDLSGNVEEWTADWYAESLGTGPSPRAGAAHVLRGGGWLSPPSQSRTTSRNWGSALEAGANVGFRCARDAEP
jgi:formylglycine-generating enzyme required for sulfatase activity